MLPAGQKSLPHPESEALPADKFSGAPYLLQPQLIYFPKLLILLRRI
jgi:hypothetical protein